MGRSQNTQRESTYCMLLENRQTQKRPKARTPTQTFLLQGNWLTVLLFHRIIVCLFFHSYRFYVNIGENNCIRSIQVCRFIVLWYWCCTLCIIWLPESFCSSVCPGREPSFYYWCHRLNAMEMNTFTQRRYSWWLAKPEEETIQ